MIIKPFDMAVLRDSEDYDDKTDLLYPLVRDEYSEEEDQRLLKLLAEYIGEYSCYVEYLQKSSIKATRLKLNKVLKSISEIENSFLSYDLHIEDIACGETFKPQTPLKSQDVKQMLDDMATNITFYLSDLERAASFDKGRTPYALKAKENLMSGLVSLFTEKHPFPLSKEDIGQLRTLARNAFSLAINGKMPHEKARLEPRLLDLMHKFIRSVTEAP